MNLVTEKELAENYIKCSERHLINMRNKRILPFIKLGRSVRYDLHAVEKALEKLVVKEVF